MLRLWKRSTPVPNQSSEIRPEIVRYASFLLGRRPYFRHQLYSKLILRCQKLKLQDYQNTVNSIVEDLAKNGYLNDSYLAEAFVRRQLAKGYGPRYIRLKLLALKLPSDSIDQALEKEAGTEVQREAAEHYLRKRRYSDPRKAFRALYMRGFDSKITQILFDSQPSED